MKFNLFNRHKHIEEEPKEVKSEPLDPKQALMKNLHELLEEENTIRGDQIIIPSWNMTIQPSIAQLSDQMVSLDFFIHNPAWDRTLYECSAALGKDQDQAMGMAVAGFLFCMMNGVRSMQSGQESYTLKTKFGGRSHLWHVYQSDLVGMGASPKKADTSMYWDLLNQDIIKHLGNQKLCYVKIFASKYKDQITGECRVNDIVSRELSQKVYEHTSKWKNEEFASYKQFFFFSQDQEGYVPYPYSYEQIRDFTRQAVRLFEESQTQEQYDQYVENLAAQIGDSHLAEEFYSFLPELCAENAFPGIEYAESASLYQKEAATTYYKDQISSYYSIQRALFEGFESGEFTTDIYRQYIAMSSIYSVICQAKEKGADLEKDGGRLALSYGFSETYEIR